MKKIYKEKLLTKGYLVLEQENTNNITNNWNVVGILNSFLSMGYTINDEGINLLKKTNTSQLVNFYNEYFPIIKKSKGANVKHIIFYKDFPFMENRSELEYWLRAIAHYSTASENNQGFMSNDIRINRVIEEIHNPEKEVLKIISEEEAKKITIEIAKNFFQSKNAIPSCEMEFLKEALFDFSDKIEINEMPFKENVATFVKLILELSKSTNRKIGDILTLKTLSFVKTTTDLLRVYGVLSNEYEGATLKGKINFISLDRKARRLFLTILNRIAKSNPWIIDELAGHEFYWKRALEKLHVGEYRRFYPKLCDVVSDFRNDEYRTFNSLVEENLTKGNFSVALKLLSKRPGEFARKLDRLLRNYDNKELVLSHFNQVSHLVSSNVLLQLWSYYKNRNLYNKRVFCVKLAHYNQYTEEEDNRKELDSVVTNKVITIIEEALIKQYSTRERIEDVFVDQSMKNYALPTNSRNSSSSNKTLTFGTRVKLDLEEGSFIRLFTHWKNSNGRVDIDLAIDLYSEDFSKSQSVAWHDMAGGRRFDTFHSGDIVTAPKGASEFVDLNYEKAKKEFRYVVVTNSVYTGQDFCDIADCFSGVMFMKEKGKKGKVFNPEFVKYKFNLTQKGSNQNIAFAIDLETMEMIWMDTPMFYAYCNIVSAGEYSVVLALKNALKEHMNLYDFMKLHSGHVSFVDSKENAKIVVSDEPNADIKPFDIELISSQWL